MGEPALREAGPRGARARDPGLHRRARARHPSNAVILLAVSVTPKRPSTESAPARKTTDGRRGGRPPCRRFCFPAGSALIPLCLSRSRRRFGYDGGAKVKDIFRGVMPALVTPSTRTDASITRRSRAGRASRQVAGPRALRRGSTGLGIMLTSDERKALTDTVVEAAAGGPASSSMSARPRQPRPSTSPAMPRVRGRFRRTIAPSTSSTPPTTSSATSKRWRRRRTPRAHLRHPHLMGAEISDRMVERLMGLPTFAR